MANEAPRVVVLDPREIVEIELVNGDVTFFQQHWNETVSHYVSFPACDLDVVIEHLRKLRG